MPSTSTRWMPSLLVLLSAACSGPEPSVVLDLARALPFAERHVEAARIDLGDLSERSARLEGFGPPRRLRDGTGFRSIAGPRASVRLWLYRPGSWMLRLRYRWTRTGPPGALLLRSERISELPPAAEWTELQRLVSVESFEPGPQVLDFEDAAGLEIDWIERRHASGAVALEAEPEHAQDSPAQAANSEWIFFASIPPGSSRAELRFGLVANGGSMRVRVLAEGEDWPVPAEATFELASGERLERQRLELPGAGLCRLSLRVISEEAGSLRWLRPALVAASDLVPAPTPGLQARLPAAPRDIFIFLLDAARGDRFGAYGHPRRTTPWVDGLAREGFVVPIARSQAPYTQSSTATLMTALEPETHDVRAVKSRLSDRAETLAEVLKTAGYATAAFIGCANADRPFGFAQGFDRFMGGRQDRTLEHVRELLQTHERNFFYIHIFQPHHPYIPPPPFAGLFSNLFPGAVTGGAAEMLVLRRTAASVPEPERERLRALYDENLAFADQRLGEVLALADRMGRARDALVLVLADHGEAFFEHGTVLHGHTVHEEEIRVPMILRPPRAWGLEPRLLPVLAGNVDVLPTVLELSHAPDPAPFRHGQSLVPLLLGQTSSPREVYARAQGPQLTAALAGERWKLHLLESGAKLFDLLADPGEQSDLAEKKPMLAGWLKQRALERHTRNVLDGQSAGLREAAVLDEETERELKALGYIE